MGSSSAEELCLRWNDFENILSRSFCEMREESDFFDVRIACFDDKSVMKTIPAHRVVLSACSPVFKELLRAIGSGGDSKGPLIFLRGITYHEMEAVLEFMYNGQTKVQHTELERFLAAAEELKIKGLTTNETPSSKKRSNNEEKKSSAAKKPRPSITPQPGPSNEVIEKPDEITVKSEEVNVEATLEDDSYPDYDESALEESYDQGAFQDDSAFPSDSKVPPVDDGSYSANIRALMAMDSVPGGVAAPTCKVCLKQYKSVQTLANHIELKHINILSYPCRYCDRVFGTRNHRSVHIHRIHREEHRAYLDGERSQQL